MQDYGWLDRKQSSPWYKRKIQQGAAIRKRDGRRHTSDTGSQDLRCRHGAGSARRSPQPDQASASSPGGWAASRTAPGPAGPRVPGRSRCRPRLGSADTCRAPATGRRGRRRSLPLPVGSTARLPPPARDSGLAGGGGRRRRAGR